MYGCINIKHEKYTLNAKHIQKGTHNYIHSIITQPTIKTQVSLKEKHVSVPVQV